MVKMRHPIRRIITDYDIDIEEAKVNKLESFIKQYIIRFLEICLIHMDFFDVRGGITYNIANIALTNSALFSNSRPSILNNSKKGAFYKWYMNRTNRNTRRNQTIRELPKMMKNNKYFKVEHIKDFMHEQYVRMHNRGKYPISQTAKKAFVKCLEYDMKFIVHLIKKEPSSPIHVILDRYDMEL